MGSKTIPKTSRNSAYAIIIINFERRVWDSTLI